jgi:putative ABC transport system permease protein
MGVDVTGDDRLIMTHKTSLIQPLPERYLADIERTKGIKEAAWASWFGGIYQDPNNFFGQMPVDLDRYLSIYNEFIVSDAHRQAWKADRQAAIVGVSTMKRFGWKVGDRIPLQATIWRPKGGGETWEFNIVGTYASSLKGSDETQFLFRHDYFDENRAFGDGLVGWYILRVTDPAVAPDVIKALDTQFENSSMATKTVPEKVFAATFANSVGNIGKMMIAIVSAVFLMLLLVAGNTMAQSVRERTSELAVLKTLGFSDTRVLSLVLLESCLLAVLAGALGLLLGWSLSLVNPMPGMLPNWYLPPGAVIAGILLTFALGTVSGLLPGIQAMRLRIVDALRRN